MIYWCARPDPTISVPSRITEDWRSSVMRLGTHWVALEPHALIKHLVIFLYHGVWYFVVFHALDMFINTAFNRNVYCELCFVVYESSPSYVVCLFEKGIDYYMFKKAYHVDMWHSHVTMWYAYNAYHML